MRNRGWKRVKESNFSRSRCIQLYMVRLGVSCNAEPDIETVYSLIKSFSVSVSKITHAKTWRYVYVTYRNTIHTNETCRKKVHGIKFIDMKHLYWVASARQQNRKSRVSNVSSFPDKFNQQLPRNLNTFSKTPMLGN